MGPGYGRNGTLNTSWGLDSISREWKHFPSQVRGWGGKIEWSPRWTRCGGTGREMVPWGEWARRTTSIIVTLLRNQLCTKNKRLWVTKRDRIAWVYGSANKMKCDFSRMPFWSSCLVFPQYSYSSCAGFNTFLFLHFSISTHLSGIVYLEGKISILIHFCHQ